MKTARLLREWCGRLPGKVFAAGGLLLLLAATAAAAAYLPYDTIASRLSCLQFSVGYGGPLDGCGP